MAAFSGYYPLGLGQKADACNDKKTRRLNARNGRQRFSPRGSTPAILGAPAAFQRDSRMCLTLGVIGSVLWAALELPSTIRIVPCRPLTSMRVTKTQKG